MYKGLPKRRKKPEFLTEIVRIYELETLPMLIDGEFNIIRHKEEKTMLTSMGDGHLF